MIALLDPTHKLSIVNLHSGEGWEAMFNPTELPETVRANYSDQQITGLSFVPRQYTNTTNHSFSLSLFMVASTENEALILDEPEDGINSPSRDISSMRGITNFLYSFLYPVQETSAAGGGPPLALVVWPNHLTMRCTIESVSPKTLQFASNGTPIRTMVEVEFQEYRATPLTSEEVRLHGVKRNYT